MHSKPISEYGQWCYLWWWAYSEQTDSDAFYVSDYDVMNNDFRGKKINANKLNFFNGPCPCASAGTALQYLEFCKDIVCISNENINQVQDSFRTELCSHYHDQEFLVLNYDIVSSKYDFSNRHVTEFSDKITCDCELIHVSNNSIGSELLNRKFLQGRGYPSSDKIVFLDWAVHSIARHDELRSRAANKICKNIFDVDFFSIDSADLMV